MLRHSGYRDRAAADALIHGPSTDAELARRLLARETHETHETHDTLNTPHGDDTASLLAAGERVLQKLHDHLSLWFGAEGFSALFSRAVDRTRPQHPVLANLVHKNPSDHRVSGFIDATRTNAPAADVRQALQALIATVFALLGRLVGEKMTMRLVEQIWPGLSRSDPTAGQADITERVVE